jgi:hypothetical protein
MRATRRMKMDVGSRVTVVLYYDCSSAMMWKQNLLPEVFYTSFYVQTRSDVVGWAGALEHRRWMFRCARNWRAEFGRERKSLFPVQIASDRQTSTKTEFEKKLTDIVYLLLCPDP